MTRIDDIFSARRASRTPALMPFVTGGYPSLDVTEDVLVRLGDAGASIIEIGFPFSDPIADGPVIAASMHEALMSGVTPTKIFDLVRRVRARTDVGLVAMVSHSIVGRRDAATFVNEAADAGFDGLIVPDIDFEAAADVLAACETRDLSFSMLIAPMTSDERIAALTQRCRGFVYLLARAGVTGEGQEIANIGARVETVRASTDLPIAVGFGISGPEHVRAVTTHADAAIVGSALVRRMGEASDPAAAAEAFVRELSTGLSTGAISTS